MTTDTQDTSAEESVALRISARAIDLFARLTGDVSSLHVDPVFARRTQYRRTIAHGMLPIAVLPYHPALHRRGHVARIRALAGRFGTPVFAGDDIVLSVAASGAGDDPSLADFDFRFVKEGQAKPVTAGSITVAYAPAESADTAEVAGLLTSSPELQNIQFEGIEVGDREQELTFRPTHGARSLLHDLWKELGSPGDLGPVDIENLSAVLLLSTSVGVSLPGVPATFFDFSVALDSDLETDEEYRLRGVVSMVSKATRIVKKQITISRPGTDEPLATGKVSALVNEPPPEMPSVTELAASGGTSLRDKVAIVTGASRGLGETIAKLLGASGAKVVVNYHSGASDAERIVGELETAGFEALAVQADVTDPDAVAEMVAATVERFGGVDILVNNAARDFRPTPFLQLDWDEVQADIDVIAKGAFLCCKAAIPHMLERGGGSIVNISTHAVEVPPPDQLKYVVAKSALVGLTRSVAVDYAARGIRANMVVPHFVETDLVAHVPQGFRKKIADEIPMKRFSSPTEVAQAVLYLASDQARFTTGQSIMVTGGAPPYV